MITKAFILGAGLGTRLRPLTEVLPKPLVPIFHEPMANYALRHCQSAGISEFAINTHHIPEAWENTYPDHTFGNASLQFFHEPTLLETGGGIRNISPFIENDPILIYNGDILTDIDIQQLIDHHEASGNIATLALRSSGENCNVNINNDGNDDNNGKDCLITDMRNLLDNALGTHQFTGIYCINPDILDLIPDGKVVSIMPAFIELIHRKKLGAIVLDDGDWFDIGNPDAYRAVHHHLRNKAPGRTDAIHPNANIHPDAYVDRNTCIIGPNATICAGAKLHNTIVWPGITVPADSNLREAIISG